VQDFFDFTSKYTTTTASPQQLLLQQQHQQQSGLKTSGHEITFPLGKNSRQK
jgi:hypothetical protein